MGEHALAIADYTRSIAVEPRSSYAHYNRGITRDRLADYDGAVADFSTAIALEPNNADFYHNRGFSLRKQGRLAEAVADYSAAIALSPRHCRAYYNRAFCHDRLGQLEQAIAVRVRQSTAPFDPATACAPCMPGRRFTCMLRPSKGGGHWHTCIHLSGAGRRVP